jgi:hypothetical protein
MLSYQNQFANFATFKNRQFCHLSRKSPPQAPGWALPGLLQIPTSAWQAEEFPDFHGSKSVGMD